MASSTVEDFFSFIQPLAIKAGELLLEGFNSEKNVETKADCYDVVTEYDRNIEKFLFTNILAKYPDHKIIGEEDTAKSGLQTLTDAPTWIIDPIDGTSNFIKRLPHTCVSIALSINTEMVLAVVNNPILKYFYTAIKGKGAFKNGQRIHVTNCQQIKDADVGCEVSLLHHEKLRSKHIRMIYYLGTTARRTLSLASVVESLCYVANGNLDGYIIEGMYPWDCAAGYLLIREAGGVVFNPHGGEFAIMKPDLVCAGTNELCQQIISIIKLADEGKSFEEEN